MQGKNFTMDEYQKLAGIKKSGMKKNMRKIEVTTQFLEYINALRL